MKNSQVQGYILLILLGMGLIGYLPFPQVKGAQWSTVDYVARDRDDGFITQSGYLIYDSLIAVLDPGMDLRSYIIFQDVNANDDHSLINATLRLNAGGAPMAFDADSEVIVRAITRGDIEGWNYTASEYLALPITSDSVTWNTSQFHSGTTVNLDVTDLVSEVMSSYAWVPNQAIGFAMVGYSAPSRWIVDGPGTSGPRLTIWTDDNITAPAGSPDAEFNETYREEPIWEEPPEDFNTDNDTEPGEGAPANNTFPWDLDLREFWVNTSYVETDPTGALNWKDNNFTRLDVNGLSGNDATTQFMRGDYPTFESAIILFALNVTNVEPEGEITNKYPMSIVQMGTSSAPHTNVNAENVHLTLNPQWDDNTKWRLRVADSGNGARDWKGATQYFTEGNFLYYIVFWVSDYTNRAGLAVYNSSSLTQSNVLYNATWTIDQAIDENWDTVSVFDIVGNGGGHKGSISADFFFMSEAWTGSSGGFITNNTDCLGPFETLEDAKACIDDSLNSTDPRDPTPPGQGYPDSGPFTRFRTMGYFLLLGIALIAMPPIYIAMKRPHPSSYFVAFVLMLIGLGLMLSVRQV